MSRNYTLPAKQEAETDRVTFQSAGGGTRTWSHGTIF